MVGGDFFEALPAADLYLLKCVLHDWDDGELVKISEPLPGGDGSWRPDRHHRVYHRRSRRPRRCGAHGPEHARDGDRQGTHTWEFDALLAKAGLRRTAVRTSDSPQNIIETVAA